MNFFDKSRELREKVAKLPWVTSLSAKNYVSIVPAQLEKSEFQIKIGAKRKGVICHTTPKPEFYPSRYDGLPNMDYIVHCVNTHEKLCEFLEKALDNLNFWARHGIVSQNKSMENLANKQILEIQTALEKLCE